MPSHALLAPLFVALFFGGGLLLERAYPARPLPHVLGWTLRACLMFVPTMAIGAMVPVLVATQFAGRSLLHLGTWDGAALGLVSSELVSYWFHRIQHQSPLLWRFTHQLHHSAERVDVLGASYFHPADVAVTSLATSLVAAILGLNEAAVMIVGSITLFAGVLQHLNVKTPVWLGYLVQRPESHSLHHERGVHASNYGNLVLWDIVFGTFRNPQDFVPAAGFYDGASARVFDMLVGRDVSTEPEHAERPALAE